MFIPYGRQDINEQDISNVIDVLKSDYITQGPAINRFEEAFAQKIGANYAFALNSATSALHIACLSLGVEKGDIVWTSPISFVASSNCALYIGAKVDFVDIDLKTFNMSIDALKEKLEEADKNGNLPKVIIPVHLCGTPCDMEEIKKLSEQYGFKIIEDASHAVGARYKDSYIGNCEYSDITVFSFHPVKIMTTGEGGMVFTNDKDISKKLELYRSHGVTRDTELMEWDTEGPWYYQQVALGFNYRMTDIQAALGLSQLERLDEFVTKRNELVEYYKNKLEDLPVSIQEISPDKYSSFHLLVINIENDSDRKAVFENLRSANIGVNVHYIPIHLQPYYKSLGFQEGDFPNAERYYKKAITLPLYPNLKLTEIDFIIEQLKKNIL